MVLPWGCPARASLARVPHGKGGPACPWGASGAAVGPGCAAPAWLCQAATAWQLAHGLTSPQGTRFPPWRIRAQPRCHLRLWGLACTGPPTPPSRCFQPPVALLAWQGMGAMARCSKSTKPRRNGEESEFQLLLLEIKGVGRRQRDVAHARGRAGAVMSCWWGRCPVL